MRFRNALLAIFFVFAFAEVSAAPEVGPGGATARIPFGTSPTNIGIHSIVGNSPQILEAYLVYTRALRFAGTTPRADKELMIMRTTQLRNGKDEFAGHKNMAITCGWITNEQADNLANWKKKPSLFSDRQRALLGFADQMLMKGHVDDKTFDQLRKQFTTQEIVELGLTSGFYAGLVQFSAAIELDQSASISASTQTNQAMVKALGCPQK